MHLYLLAILAMFSATAFADEPGNYFDPLKAYELMQRDEAILVDVREEQEILSGMAAGGAWLPTSKIEADAPEYEAFMASLDGNKTLIIYCGTGKRAARIVAKISADGIAAENMGEFSRWVDVGLPVVKPVSQSFL